MLLFKGFVTHRAKRIYRRTCCSSIFTTISSMGRRFKFKLAGQTSRTKNANEILWSKFYTCYYFI